MALQIDKKCDLKMFANIVIIIIIFTKESNFEINSKR